MSNNPYEHGLDKCAANHVPLSPLSFIARTAQIYPNRLAVVHGARRFTWAETYTRCRRLASALAARGIKRGDTVAVMLPNVPAMVEAHFGVPMIGAVLNTLNTRLDPGFNKLIPMRHAYMEAFLKHSATFSGANRILVSVEWKGQGDIYNREFLEALRGVTDEVFFTPGVNRGQVYSLYTPNVKYIEITEDGYVGEVLIPSRFEADAEGLAQVERVRNVARRLIPGTGAFRPDAPSWKWEVNVLSSNELNAWCMAGGKIAFYTGIIDRLQLTDDEIAAIMGHEIAHALREHARERASQTMMTNIGVSVLGAVLGAGQVGTDLIGTVAKVSFQLPNSREHETEADRMGVELAARGGYDPRAAISLWQKMAKASNGGPPQWLSTHPSNETRQGDLAQYAARVMPLYEQATQRPRAVK